jgi:hypothetical protein
MRPLWFVRLAQRLVCQSLHLAEFGAQALLVRVTRQGCA